MTAPHDVRAAAERVDRLLERLRSGPDPRAAVIAEELIRCLIRLYGAGLERVVRIVGPDGGRDLCADPLVESLLLVHDLHPLDPDTRIRRALDHVRAHLGSPAALEYLGLDAAGVARVRLIGGGCRSAGATVPPAIQSAVETAIRDAAPETAGVAVEAAAAPPPLLQISRRPDGATP
jgi:hypothetical protein